MKIKVSQMKLALTLALSIIIIWDPPAYRVTSTARPDPAPWIVTTNSRNQGATQVTLQSVESPHR